jgi:phosphopantothenoylcysteine synthetase/decarboxylase
MNILFGVTASISAYKTPDIVNCLVKNGHSVQVVLTRGAENFVTEMSLSTMSHKPVLNTLWNEIQGEIHHIELTQRWAELFIVCPASANIIAKMAHGIADDILSTMYLAIPASVGKIIFPAMNHIMLNHNATKRNIELLRNDGVDVQSTRSGVLACQEIGEGLLQKTSDIVNYINKYTCKKESTIYPDTFAEWRQQNYNERATKAIDPTEGPYYR